MTFRRVGSRAIDVFASFPRRARSARKEASGRACQNRGGSPWRGAVAKRSRLNAWTFSTHQDDACDQHARVTMIQPVTKGDHPIVDFDETDLREVLSDVTNTNMDNRVFKYGGRICNNYHVIKGPCTFIA